MCIRDSYKLEHMADLADETEFSFFQQGEYVDMCVGPHLCYTKALKAFKLSLIHISTTASTSRPAHPCLAAGAGLEVLAVVALCGVHF